MGQWRAIVVILSSLFLLTSRGFAMDRQALFSRAFQSMSFILSAAYEDPSFITGLTSEEKKMLIGVLGIAQEARNYQWLQQQKVTPFLSRGLVYYPFLQLHKPAIGMSREEVVSYYSSHVEFGLEFSDDQARFNIVPGEPTRTAMTYSTPEPSGKNEPLPVDNKAIFVNRLKINDPKNMFSFSDVISILVHEFGHKLGKLKNQEAVNSLAAKVKSFLDTSKSTQFDVQGGKLHVLRLNVDFFSEWLEIMLEGRFMGVNIPNQLEPLRVMSNEGFYVFYESQLGVFDLTDAILTDIKSGTRDKIYEGMPYDWKDLHWFWSSNIELKEQGDKLTLQANVTHVTTATPFLKSGDPDPRSVQALQQIVSKDAPYTVHEQRSEWSIQVKNGVPKILKGWPKPRVLESPDIVPKKGERIRQGDDLVLEYFIDDLASLRGMDIQRSRWILTFRTEESPHVEVIGTAAMVQSGLHMRFVIPGFYRVQGHEISVKAIEVQQSQTNLASESQMMRTRLLMTEPESFQSGNGNLAKVPFYLKSLQIWNGKNWEPLRASQKSIVKGAHLKLVINSDSQLVDLKLMLGTKTQVTRRVTTLVDGRNQDVGEPYSLMRAENSKLIQFSLVGARQELKGSSLEVILPVDQDLILAEHLKQDMTPFDLGPLGGAQFRLYEERLMQTHPDRELLGVEATNESFQQTKVFLKNTLQFRKDDNLRAPLRPQLVLQCKSIFN